MRGLLRLVVGLLVLSAAPAYAQTGPCPTTADLTLNPSRACFTPSPDHEATLPVSGLPMLVSYELQWFDAAVDPANPNAQPIQAADVGKPAPNAQGAIWITSLPAYPVGRRFRAVAIAKGQQGTTSPRSAPSNPFGVEGPVTPREPSRVVVP